MKVVFDTNVLVSALVFNGKWLWLRSAWQGGKVTPLASRETVDELVRVLAYQKFRLGHDDIDALLGDYLPWVEAVKVIGRPGPACRDPDDQKFVELAIIGNADVIVSGDKALLEMEMSVPVETPAEFRKRFSK